jgi:excisionase family DNA binding protein
MRSGLPSEPERGPATVADLQEVTGLGRTAVKAAIVRGELPGSKVGGRYVIPREAFDRYVRGEWVAQPRHIDIQPLPTVRLLHRRVG